MINFCKIWAWGVSQIGSLKVWLECSQIFLLSVSLETMKLASDVIRSAFPILLSRTLILNVNVL